MEIIEEDFKLKPVSEDNARFDLELLYTIKPRGGEPRQEFKNAAYGIDLKYAINKIAHYRVCCNHPDDAIKLKTYYQEFLQELKNINKLINI